LARSIPLWPIEIDEWDLVIATVREFSEAWDAIARSEGWDSMSLYSLHRSAPYARLDGMGAAWLLAVRGRQAIAVQPDHILLATALGARLCIYRGEPTPDATLAWELI
jgi:hypothetical protein